MAIRYSFTVKKCRGRLWVAGLLMGLLACNQAPDKTANPAEDTAQAPSGPAFRFSRHTPEAGKKPDNWCYGHFSEPLVINAEEGHPNRRYFYLQNGVTKVAVGPSGITTTFMLRPEENGMVEVFTGANFPECLSIPGNFSPLSGGPVVRYMNHKKVGFSLETKQENGYARVTMEMPKGTNYGLSANYCPDCK